MVILHGGQDSGVDKIVSTWANNRNITQRLLAHAHPFEVYIAKMPQGFKDPEEFLLQHDVQALINETHYAIGMGEYLAIQLTHQYPKRDASRPLPAMQRTRLLEAAEPFRTQLASFPYDLGDFERIIKMAVEG